jgi:hypothetical protein
MAKFLAFLCFSWIAIAQVYTANITNVGSNYPSATVTATGGGCATEPTFAATVNSSGGTLATIVPTYAGTGCTSAPTLTVSGSGTGGAATALLLPSSIAILSAVPSLSGQSIQVSTSGQYTAWQFACILVVPPSRVPFVAAKLYNFPGSSQITEFVSQTPAGYTAALASGIITEFQDSLILPGSASGTLTTAQSQMVTDCAAQQTALNSWNSWPYYGTRYLNGTWINVTVN